MEFREVLLTRLHEPEILNLVSSEPFHFEDSMLLTAK